MSEKTARPPRRPWLSLMGAGLAALYLAAFVAGYLIYLQNAGQWLADLPLLLIALPFTLAVGVLSEGFSMTGDETGKVTAAALFCSALAYIAGALLEWLFRRLWRLAKRAS